MSHFNTHLVFNGGLEMALNLQVHKYPIWFSKVKPELLFSIHVALRVTWEVFICWGTPLHQSNDIHGVCVCVCVCLLECLTFPQRAGFTQRLCHTSPIWLIAGQRLPPDRQGLLLDFCVIKYLFGKISQGILEWNGDTPLQKSDPL